MISAVLKMLACQRQERPLSPVVLKIFPQKYLKTANGFDSSISIEVQPLCNVQFADDIGLQGGSVRIFQQLTDRLEKAAAQYGINARESEIFVSSIESRSPTIIKMNGQWARHLNAWDPHKLQVGHQ